MSEDYRDFFNSIPHSEPEASTLEKTYIYAEDPTNPDELIILPLETTLEEAIEAEAKWSAGTFGEFFHLCPGRVGEFWWSRMLENSRYCYIQDLAKERGVTDTRKVRAEWDALSPYGGRPPRNEDPFDAGRFDEMRLEEEMDFFIPNEVMIQLVPKPVLKRFGRVDCGLFNGPLAFFDAANEAGIVKMLEEEGCIVVKDPFLVAAIYGQGPGYEEIQKRADFYENLDEVLKGIVLGKEAAD